MLDYIIVGQGLAGSLLSWFLLQEGKRVLVIDQFNPSSASRVAGGLVNPITGRKFVKTWLADDLFPFAKDTYCQLENILGEPLYKLLPVVHVFDSIKQQNDWSVRCATPEYKQYLSNETILRFDSAKVKNDLGAFEISGSYKLDTGKFLSIYRNYLKQQDSLLEEPFDYTALALSNNFVTYKGYQAKHIIFCEGVKAMQNPYFSYLPFQPAKGECLHITIDDFYTDKVLKDEVAIMPISGNEYYIGATHDKFYDTTAPTEKGKEELVEKLSRILNSSYTITAHKAAVRPATKHRRPFIGLHPQHKQVGIFNGLGTKGVSLAPYFAKHFVNHLLRGEQLIQEVDIARLKIEKV